MTVAINPSALVISACTHNSNKIFHNEGIGTRGLSYENEVATVITWHNSRYDACRPGR